MARNTVIRLGPLLVALSLGACGQAPEQTASAPQALVAEPPQGKTYDNPFGGNAVATEEAATTDDMTATDPVATPGASAPVEAPEPAPVIVPVEREPRMSRPSGSSCNDGKRVCGDMDSCEDAQFHLQQCGMRRLDGDGDGTPCEKICG